MANPTRLADRWLLATLRGAFGVGLLVFLFLNSGHSSLLAQVPCDFALAPGHGQFNYGGGTYPLVGNVGGCSFDHPTSYFLRAGFVVGFGPGITVQFNPSLYPRTGFFIGCTFDLAITCSTLSITQLGNPSGVPLLNVPPIRQDTSTWAGIQYDHQDTTIEQFGCFLTASTMLVNWFGAKMAVPPFTPVTLNAYLKGIPWGYDRDGDVDPSAVAGFARANRILLYFQGMGGIDAQPHSICQTQVDCDSVVSQSLAQGNPVMVSVTVASQDNGKNNHWVLITGTTTINGQPTFTISDPAHYGSGTLLDFPLSSGHFGNIALFGSTPTRTGAISISIHSPIEMTLSDPFGSLSGVDASNQTFYNQIPNSAYYHLSLRDDAYSLFAIGPSSPVTKRLEVISPVQGGYIAKMVGTGTGTFSVEFVIHDANDVPIGKQFFGLTIHGLVTIFRFSTDAVQSLSVTAPCPADVNGDGRVDSADLAVIRASFGSKSGQPQYNSGADLNHDGVINIVDLAFASRTVGCTTQVQ